MTEIKKDTLTAILIGDTNIKDYEIKTHIKAVTYNDMLVEEKPFKVQLVLDI